MPRTPGALNKRTRIALTAAAEGKLADGAEHTLALVMGIANDPARDDAIRLQAANVLLPYVKPRLAFFWRCAACGRTLRVRLSEHCSLGRTPPIAGTSSQTNYLIAAR